MLDNISVTQLKSFSLDSGDVKHILKKSDKDYRGYGETYISFIKFNHVKGWKRHKRMTMNLVVPIGAVKFVFYDNLSSTFREEIIGNKNYCRLTVPPNIWFSFKGISRENNLIFNISDIEHDPKEQETLNINKIK